MDIDSVFFQVFKMSVCNGCKEKFPERYSLITKTEAREVSIGANIGNYVSGNQIV